MRLDPLEKFGFAGQAVGFVVSLFSWVGVIITVAAAVPLFVGQNRRHKRERDELTKLLNRRKP